MSDLATVRAALHTHTPRLAQLDDAPRAAVAAIFHELKDDPETDDIRLLFIERATRDGDPWSGDLAFPGGRVEPDDTDIHHTAERETHEEIGWSLDPAERLGRLDDMTGHVVPITVAACVYATRQVQTPTLSSEVVDVFWTPVADLLDPQRRVLHTLRRRSEERQFPALDVLGPGRPLLWGVTYRFVTDLMRFLGHELPT
jgi:8-oxo-dGTP pyrophosphatase MutT (NUDIX family)